MNFQIKKGDTSYLLALLWMWFWSGDEDLVILSPTDNPFCFGAKKLQMTRYDLDDVSMMGHNFYMINIWTVELSII